MDYEQMSMEDITPEYKAFVDKFKPVKTTDDCYTPPLVYDAVRDWACAEYEIDPDKIVRPFYPGGDYERFDYSDGRVVLYPDHVLTAAMLQKYSKYGIDYKVRRGDCVLIPALDAQRAAKKEIYGKGLLLSERAAAERAAAKRWELSAREKDIIKTIGQEATTHD